MILCITDVVSYKSIICMILVYDTIHYDQPKYNSALYMAFLHMSRKESKEKVEKWALMQETTSTWWSIGRGTCMEVVRNRETHAGRSAAVKMIMASQITGAHLSAVTHCQITQPYICSSLLPRLLASLSNRPGRTAPPTMQENPRPRLLNSTLY